MEFRAIILLMVWERFANEACTRNIYIYTYDVWLKFDNTSRKQLQDGVRATVEAFSQLAAKDPIYSTQRDFTRPSKSDTFLGNGRGTLLVSSLISFVWVNFRLWKLYVLLGLISGELYNDNMSSTCLVLHFMKMAFSSFFSLHAVRCLFCFCANLDLDLDAVADILLWRDEKKTFFCVMVLFFLRYWFILSGRTLISSFAKLLLVVTAILFGHGHLPSSM